MFRTGTHNNDKDSAEIIQSPMTLYWNDDMCIFIDRREWYKYKTGIRLS